MVTSNETPEYKVGLRQSCRPSDRQDEPEVGISWEVTRFTGQKEGTWQNSEVLFVSPKVFVSEDEAKRDAVQPLESLLCCDNSPLRVAFRTAIDWMVDES